MLRVIRAGDTGAVGEAAEVIMGGGIVAYPTETFYALGARADDEGALERLFALKGRSQEKAFPLISSTMDAVKEICLVRPGRETELAERHWPGPLTMILEARGQLCRRITYGGKVAVRVPGGDFARALAGAVGSAVTATSANPSGMPPACKAEEVTGYFGEGIDLLVDGGRTPCAGPTTIVEVEGDRIIVLRTGVLPEDGL